MEKIPFHQRFIKSINDPVFVANSIKEKTGSVILYAMIVLLLFAGISGAVKGIYFNNYIKEVLAVVNTPDFPDFRLGDGQFYINSDQPIIVEQEDFIFAIDTSGQTTVNDIINYTTGYLLTDTTLIVSLAGDTNYIDLDTLSWYEVSKDELVQSLELTTSIGIVLYTIGNIIVAFFTVAMRSLILLFIANILRRMLQLEGLKGSMLYNMVLYSITIGIILFQLFSIIPNIFPGSIVSELFFTAGSVLFFYIPSSTVLSRALKHLKLHEELTKLEALVQEKKKTNRSGNKPQVYQSLNPKDKDSSKEDTVSTSENDSPVDDTSTREEDSLADNASVDEKDSVIDNASADEKDSAVDEDLRKKEDGNNKKEE